MDSSLQTLQEIDDTEIAKSVTCSIGDLPIHLPVKKYRLNIVHQNIRSIYRNFDDFEISLSQLKHDVDVIILTECWLGLDKPIPHLTNYTAYFTTRFLNQNDGVIAYIKNNHRVKIKEIMLTHASCIQITIFNYIILGIYRSPSKSKADDFINSLDLYLETIKSQQNIIITGDMNINLASKHNEQTCERNNRQNYLTSLTMHSILPGHSFPTRELACLDHFMLKLNKKRTLAFIAVLNTSITDHLMILLTLSENSMLPIHSKTKTIVNYDDALRSLQEVNFLELFIHTDPNLFTDLLISKISTALLEHTKILSISRQKRILKPYITEGILRCILNRNNMQRKLKLDPKNDILRITFRRYRNYCNCLIKKLKRKYERDKLIISTKNNKTLWKTINEITQFKQSKTSNINLLNIASSPLISVNRVNVFFAGIGKTLAEEILSKKVVLGTNVSTVCYQQSSFVLLDTDPQEVKNTLMSIDSNSSQGCDNIPTKFLKLSQNILVPIISHLVNLCFSSGIFPRALKKSIVTPVYKSGDRDDVNNYRPISVLPALSKIMEKLINNRLLNYLNKYNLLSKHQYGFRKGISTEDAILDLSTLLVKNMDNGKKCLTVFLDLKKAFDTVSVPILLQKLEDIGIRGTAHALFQSYLSDRKQRVKIGDVFSEDINIYFGVPQGSITGPTLFLIYINNLCNMDIPAGKIFTYADDTAIVFSGNTWEEVRSRAETGLARVAKWLDINLLTLNTVKTNYICFSIRNSTQPDSNFEIKIHNCNRQSTQNCNCPSITRIVKTKYLGVNVDQRLSWHSHIDLISGRVRKLTWIFKTLRHVATGELLNKIYIALVQSVLMYCIPVWGGASKTKILELEIAQRMLLKVMYFKPSRFPTTEIYILSNILSIRKLYILHVICKLHRSMKFDKKKLNKRRNDIVAPSQSTKTTFARNQYTKQSAFLYNRVNRILSIYPMKYYDCKNALTKWLQLLNYNEIELFLNVPE